MWRSSARFSLRGRTLRTRELPEHFGAVFGTIRATSDEAFRRLLGRIIGFYRDRLFNAHWGEQLVFGRGNTVRIAMVFQGLDRHGAERIWHPFLDWITRMPSRRAHGRHRGATTQ